MTIADLKDLIEIKNNYASILRHESNHIWDRIQTEEDEAHVIMLKDHLAKLGYELDSTNAELFILRQKLKRLKN